MVIAKVSAWSCCSPLERFWVSPAIRPSGLRLHVTCPPQSRARRVRSFSCGFPADAQIEGTANEHEALKVEGFPTILLFPSGEDQTPIPFDGGDRSLKVLVYCRAILPS